jgi:hypothetical protein
MHLLPLQEISWQQVLVPFAILFPSIRLLLAVGHLVSNCDLRCIIALAGIAAYLAICSVTYVCTYL